MYLTRARGSLYELQIQVELAESSALLDGSRLETLMAHCDEVGRMIHGLMSSMKDASC